MENLDWKNLPFGYVKTDYNARCHYRNGKWGEIEISSSEEISIHMAATCLHYGQEAFEGIKAYKGADGKIRVFRWRENVKRMGESSKGILMAEVPEEIFGEAIFRIIKLNRKFVPPYGSGASLYIRPLLIGTTPKVGVAPASEYLFLLFVTPVGPYFKCGLSPVKMVIRRDFDRAAPNGTGHIKIGGNYAASLLSLKLAHDDGYSSVLYLDSKEKKFIDETGTANFFGIKNNSYITPDSRTTLPSITNMSILDLAKDLGMRVEKRPVRYDELEGFEETGSCGTATIISPIKEIADPEMKRSFYYCKDGKPGPLSLKLYNKLTAIQNGEEPDIHGWNDIVD